MQFVLQKQSERCSESRQGWLKMFLNIRGIINIARQKSRETEKIIKHAKTGIYWSVNMTLIVLKSTCLYLWAETTCYIMCELPLFYNNSYVIIKT